MYVNAAADDTIDIRQLHALRPVESHELNAEVLKVKLVLGPQAQKMRAVGGCRNDFCMQFRWRLLEQKSHQFPQNGVCGNAHGEQVVEFVPHLEQLARGLLSEHP